MKISLFLASLALFSSSIFADTTLKVHATYVTDRAFKVDVADTVPVYNLLTRITPYSGPYSPDRNLSDCVVLEGGNLRCIEIATQKQIILLLEENELTDYPYKDIVSEYRSMDGRYHLKEGRFNLVNKKNYGTQTVKLPESIVGNIESYRFDDQTNQLIVNLNTGRSYVFSITIVNGQASVRLLGELTKTNYIQLQPAVISTCVESLS